VASRRADEQTAPAPAPVRLCVHRPCLTISWPVSRDALALDASPGAPWLFLPADARAAFDRLARGIPLAASGIGRPTLGVKCGVNDAFLVNATGVPGPRVTVSDGRREAQLEASCLRPVLRGEVIRAWRSEPGPAHIVYPCGDDGRPLRALPPGVRSWLLPWRARLEQRTDGRGARAWWSLFRTESARGDRPRVVWADIGRVPQALVLEAGDPTIALNTCYVLRTRDLDDALTLAAILNTPLAAAWLGAIAEPARGSYRRFMAWTVARLPLPDDWARARALLAPLGARARSGDPPARTELLAAVLDAYRVRLRTMAPLLGWMTG
jgi:hypothetical protein